MCIRDSHVARDWKAAARAHRWRLRFLPTPFAEKRPGGGFVPGFVFGLPHIDDVDVSAHFVAVSAPDGTLTDKMAALERALDLQVNGFN